MENYQKLTNLLILRKAGADAVKFQSFIADEMATKMKNIIK